jgi:hypothetical protein
MATYYDGQNRSQRERREVLINLNHDLGNVLFSEFIIDILSEYGNVSVQTLPSLIYSWRVRKVFELELY